MKNNLKLFFVCILSAMSLTMSAAPALRRAVSVTDADGITRVLYTHGDEVCHYLTDDSGVRYQLVADADGKRVVPFVESENSRRRAFARSFHAANAGRRVNATAEEAQGKSAYRVTPANILVVLAEFKDVQFQAENTRSVYSDYFNAADYTGNGATGSVRRYFSDQSYGQYAPEFDVVGPVALSSGYSYYGDNDEYGDDLRAELMVYQACKAAAEQNTIDFSRYDADGDGYVDAVIVVYAGKGEADSQIANAVWPHTGSLEMADVDELVLGGKTLDTYICVPELSYKKALAGIGTVCHEFAHVLGLPNVCTTNGDDFKTWGDWDVMDHGSYNNEGRTPPAFSAYERFFMGWIEPVLFNEPMNVALRELSASGDCGLVTQSGQHNLNGVNPDPREFFLLENRQQTGWDAYIPGHGMLLSKIEFVKSKWDDDIVNILEYNQCIDLIEADGKKPKYKADNTGNGYFGKQGDLFPAGATSKTFFSNNWYFDNASEKNGIVYLDFQGGVERCTVTFFAGANGTCSVTELTEKSKRAGVTLPTVSAKSGYTFLGWATRKNATRADAGQAGDTYYPMSDCTLFALYRNDTRVDINYDLKGVEWNTGTATAYANRGKGFEITFTAKAGYLTPTPSTCQVRVLCGSQAMPNYVFENDMVVVRFADAEVTDNIYIGIRNTREQKADGCEAYSHTFSSRVGSGEYQDFGGYDWTVEIGNENTIDYDKSKKAAVFGSNSYPAERVSLKTEETMGCGVSEVRVTACTASNGDALLSVRLAGNPIGEEYLEETMQTFAFQADEPESGMVEILITNTKKAIYLKSVAINFAYWDGNTGAAINNTPAHSAEVYGADRMIVAQGLQTGDVVCVYDVQGRCLSETLAETNTLLLPFDPGFYLVSIRSQSAPQTTKVVVR